METHLKVVAGLNIVLGGLSLLGGLAGMLVFGGAAGLIRTQPNIEPEAGTIAGIVGLIGGAVFLIIVAASFFCVLAGLGLLKRREWARILGIVLSALLLIVIPIGTVIGAYSLWVLLSRNTQALFPKKAPPAQAA